MIWPDFPNQAGQGFWARFFGADAPQNDKLARFMTTRAFFNCHPEPFLTVILSLSKDLACAKDLAGT